MKISLMVLASVLALSGVAQAEGVAHQCTTLIVYGSKKIEKLANTGVSIYKDNTAVISAAGQKQPMYAYGIEAPAIDQIPMFMASYGEKVSAEQVASVQSWQLCEGSPQCALGEIPRRYLEVTLKSGKTKSLFYWNGETMKCGSTQL